MSTILRYGPHESIFGFLLVSGVLLYGVVDPLRTGRSGIRQ